MKNAILETWKEKLEMQLKDLRSEASSDLNSGIRIGVESALRDLTYLLEVFGHYEQ